MAQTVTLTLPDAVYFRLKRAAQITYRSMDDIVASTVAASFVSDADLPEGLAAELTAMRFFSDDALWAATHPSMSDAEQQRLAQLNMLVKERTLTLPEQAEQEALLDAYNLSMLRRAQALALLKQRGHDITPALQPLQDA